MAGELQTTMSDAFDRMWSRAEVSATYNGSAITILSDEFDSNLADAPDANGRMSVGTIEVKKTDVTLPGYRDTVVIDGSTFYVLRIETHDWYSWTISLYRAERPGPGGRR